MNARADISSLDTISALAVALESRDGGTGEHIKRTHLLAGQVARRLGLSAEEARVARYGAVLHDIGKIGIPDAVLNKPSRLTDEEWEVMRRHPNMGADMVNQVSGFEPVAEVVLAHHERHDGLGYPKGLAGEEIPMGARLISAADAYDAMTNDRPYREALTHEQAVAELEANSGGQFDPEVVEALIAVLLEHPSQCSEHKPKIGRTPTLNPLRLRAS
ncbi:MAG: HD-GYP domain-containing protein [Rubrobacter sp.]|nr:HD-GYP domain-containing protein [Rubrobacter sp.]